MRQVEATLITEEIAKMCIEANTVLAQDTYKAIEASLKTEVSPLGRNIIKDLMANADLAKEKGVPICQDTGMTVAFVEIGQCVAVVGGLLEDAINAGVRKGYQEGYLRKSVVEDPLNRKNTGDNTPAVIYYDIVAGDRIKIKIAPKGFGSENMSRCAMLKPAQGRMGVEAFVLETIDMAGANPCPPIVVGIGIGGTLDKASQLAKKALVRPLKSSNSDPYYAQMEKEMLEKINCLGIGPQGLGGTTTALAVHIEKYPTHIAGLPVVVNINCHASRHVEVEL